MGTKILAGKGYGHIPHLPGSRMGPGDHHCHEGQARICTEKARDRHDRIIVQEKLDGCCVGVVKQGDVLYPINRAGHLAISSPYEHHRLFALWALEPAQYDRFWHVLRDGERLMGEWLALAHGTRYKLEREPFVVFDLMQGNKRLALAMLSHRVLDVFVLPALLSTGEPVPIEKAMTRLSTYGQHGALDPVEGVVYRVERKGQFDFLAKYVRPDKIDGRYLPEISGGEAVWNWSPKEATCLPP